LLIDDDKPDKKTKSKQSKLIWNIFQELIMYQITAIDYSNIYSC
jgi:hypothetical protein